MLRKLAEKEQEHEDIISTCEGTGTLNRFTQIHNDTTLNTCNISDNVSRGNKHEKGGCRSDTIGLKGSCDAAEESRAETGFDERCKLGRKSRRVQFFFTFQNILSKFDDWATSHHTLCR